MSNFKSYNQLESFHMSIYRVQTRIVLFEKFSEETERRRIAKYHNKIMFQPSITEEEAAKILQERRERVIKLTGISDLKFDKYDKETLRVTDISVIKYLNPYENNDPNSMWLDICELF
jgi:hypothetical protein